MNPSTNKNRSNPTHIWCLLFALPWMGACARSPKGDSSSADAGIRSPERYPDQRGSVSGTVRLKGAPPSLPPLRPSGDVRRFCGDEIPDRTFLVGSGGALANAVISLEGDLPRIASASVPNAPVLDQKGCMYLPPVVVASTGASLEVINSDPLLHNVHASLLMTPVFNMAMPLQGQHYRKELPRVSGRIRVRCDLHPWMHAVIQTFDHPYFALTDALGSYRIADVPSGKYKLIFWHERLPQRTVELSLAPGQAVEKTMEWAAADLER